MAITEEGRQHLLEIANRIRTEPDRFDMEDFYTKNGAHVFPNEWDCDTAACIAGWSAVISGDLEDFTATDLAVRTGLSRGEAWILCYDAGVEAASAMPEHLRAEGMADAVEQVANGVGARTALDDVRTRYATAH